MTDLFKTILDLTGVSVPSGIEHDSVSLASVLNGGNPTGDRNYAFSEYIAQQRTARNGRYKLLHLASTTEFYDLDQVATDSTCATDLLVAGLTPQEQENYDDIQEYLDYLDGTLATCSGASCSSFPGCQRLFPPQCQTFTIPTTACAGSSGIFLQCAPDETMWVRSCHCEAITPGTLCPNDDQVITGCQ